MSNCVMIVDDSRTIRTAVDLIFQKTEFTPILAKSADEAIAQLIRLETKPAVVIIDAGLPDRDGHLLAREVRHCAPTAAVLIMVSTETPEHASISDGEV